MPLIVPINEDTDPCENEQFEPSMALGCSAQGCTGQTLVPLMLFEDPVGLAEYIDRERGWILVTYDVDVEPGTPYTDERNRKKASVAGDTSAVIVGLCPAHRDFNVVVLK